MAGKPKTRLMMRELERRTRELFPDEPERTHLDYAEHYVANGGTLVSLAKSLAGSTGTHVMRESLRRILHKMEGGERRLAEARIHSSYALVESAVEILDEDMDREDVPRAKLRVDGKLKVATMLNRGEFGENRGVSVSVNLGAMHLDALRARAVANIITVPTTLALPAEDADVVELLPAAICESHVNSS